MSICVICKVVTGKEHDECDYYVFDNIEDYKKWLDNFKDNTAIISGPFKAIKK